MSDHQRAQVGPSARIGSVPRWLVSCKVLLLVLLAVGAVFPHVGGFDGKGMVYRLPLFAVPALIIPVRWWRRGGPYDVALDAALTIPFLLDTAANAFGVYDHFSHTDDLLHFLNWFVLVGGIALSFRQRPSAVTAPDWLVVVAAAGIGAIVAIAWEVAEYGVMRAGVGNLHLTYADTLSDLVLGTIGGTVGALLAMRLRTRLMP